MRSRIFKNKRFPDDGTEWLSVFQESRVRVEEAEKKEDDESRETRELLETLTTNMEKNEGNEQIFQTSPVFLLWAIETNGAISST